MAPFELLTMTVQETQNTGYYCSPWLAPRSLKYVSIAEEHHSLWTKNTENLSWT